MESIRDALRTTSRGSGHWAAASVACGTEVLQQAFADYANSLQATHVRDRTLFVRVNHSAIIGLIQMRESELLEKINTTMRSRFADQARPLEKIVARIA